jgi:prepilin-type N-terminal cleavage/methylation domain-containing protein
MKNNKKGFTLIELLVVIAIIGLLSTLAVVALGNARSKSRDARRVADIKQIQTSLELFYNDENRYPDGQAAGETVTAGTSITGTNETFMQVVPANPTPNGATYVYTACTSAGVCANPTATAGSYTLSYSLEGITGGIASGAHTATPAGIQ